MNAVQCGLVIALSLPVSACIYAGSDVRRSADESDSEELRQALRRVVLVGEVSDRNHALRMREAAALAVSKRQPSMSEVQQIIDIMVDELVRAGAANDLKQAYRVQDVYPVVQAACQISDEELLIALLKHLRPQKRGERQIADRIVQDANLWRTGVRFGRREFLVISTAIERGHLTDPRQDETGVLLSNTLWDQVPAYWTWRRYGQSSSLRSFAGLPLTGGM